MNTSAFRQSATLPELRTNFWILLVSAIVMCLFAVNADAQVVTIDPSAGASGTIGQAAWTNMKNLWFGPLGLALGAGVFALSLYFFFKEGVLAVLGVLAMGTLFFFIPGIVVAIQGWAKSI